MSALKDKVSDETRIRDVIDSWMSAIRRKDAAALVSHHGDGYVHFSLAPPLISDGSDVRGYNAWFDTWHGPLGYELQDLTVKSSGDLAFCHGLARLSGDKIGERKIALWFRLTLGFRKIGSDWKLVHEHESVPFYMDGSLRAAVDLAP